MRKAEYDVMDRELARICCGDDPVNAARFLAERRVHRLHFATVKDVGSHTLALESADYLAQVSRESEELARHSGETPEAEAAWLHQTVEAENELLRSNHMRFGEEIPPYLL